MSMPKTVDATKSHQTLLVWKPVASASISGDLHLKKRIFVFHVAEECYQFLQLHCEPRIE